MRLGRIWAFKIKAVASHGHFLNTLGVPCCPHFATRTPALPRFASRSVTIENFCEKFFKMRLPVILLGMYLEVPLLEVASFKQSLFRC